MIRECLLVLLGGGCDPSLTPASHQAQETAEFLAPAPAANQGPRRRGRWAQPGVELSVRSMLDLRQLETLTPSSRGASQDLLAMTPSCPGKHGQQAPETSHASQVSQPSPSSLSQPYANGWGPSAGPAVLALPLW